MHPRVAFKFIRYMSQLIGMGVTASARVQTMQRNLP